MDEQGSIILPPPHLHPSITSAGAYETCETPLPAFYYCFYSSCSVCVCVYVYLLYVIVRYRGHTGLNLTACTAYEMQPYMSCNCLCVLWMEAVQCVGV